MSASLTGRCHCHNLQLTFEASREPRALPARACGCSFCRARGMRWTSDPNGHVVLRVGAMDDLIRYRFGTETAEFLLCGRCGGLALALSEVEDGQLAVVNIDMLSSSQDFPPATSTDFEGETVDARLARRAKTWTPARLVDEAPQRLGPHRGHRSRLGQILIDCNEAHWEQAQTFWSTALGLEPRAVPKDTPRYIRFPGRPGMPDVLLQRVTGASGYHLDVESDDVEAEVARLEALGARRKRKVGGWWVMEAPTGHPLCVVPTETHSFPEHANQWPGAE